MRFRIRRPSIRKSIAARTSGKRVVRNTLGLRAPRGFGWFTNPRRATYNRIYNRTTRGCFRTLLSALIGVSAISIATIRCVLG
ncbi:MAG: hypothetical protein M1132_05590 [Chloroflexi bacterium]|nr:hypothetical protein [Chloroflexota bacterium]